MVSPCSPQQVHPLPSLQDCCFSGALTAFSSIYRHVVGLSCRCTWWFRRHYVFIFICCWRRVMLFSFQRRGTEALGLRAWLRHWWQWPEAWQVFSRTAPLEGHPPPSANPAWQTKKQRKPLGSNIHLVTALILPALSSVTVSKAPWSSGAKQRLKWSLHSHLKLAM